MGQDTTPGEHETADPGLDTIGERLNFLFATVRPSGSHRYTFREVAAAINTAAGEQLISASYIHHLCTGARDNPGTKQLTALARFFGVPPGFLLGDADTDTIAAELRQLRDTRALRDALDDPNVRVLAMKARGLSDRHLKLVLAMLDEVRKLEQDPPADPPGSAST